MLRLETETGAPAIRATAFASKGSVEEVAGIELHAGFGRVHVERPSGVRLVHVRGVMQ